MEIVRGIECSEFCKEKKASKTHRYYYAVTKRRLIEGARVAVRRGIEGAGVAASRTAPVEDSEDGVSNSAVVGHDLGNFDFENAFGDDLSDFENTFDDAVNDYTCLVKADVDIDSMSVGPSLSSSSYVVQQGEAVCFEFVCLSF